MLWGTRVFGTFEFTSLILYEILIDSYFLLDIFCIYHQVIAPQSVSGVILDSPEASKLLSAVAIALTNCSRWSTDVEIFYMELFMKCEIFF